LLAFLRRLKRIDEVVLQIEQTNRTWRRVSSTLTMATPLKAPTQA
jgi:hypothetical protein